ncbi:MAG: hypothetical protein GXP31_14935 [Kiritimatiellaeota bacterium]|nr:hypothetical protein [Kiritimatiellota bacterium]
MKTLRLSFAIAASVLSACAVPPGDLLPVFEAARPEVVRERWRSEFGSQPVRIASLEEGACLTFPARFIKPGDRVCWDWHGALDLSKAGRITFEMLTSNRRVTGTVGVYFGTPHGWYARFIGPGAAGTWKRVVLSLADFGIEGKPDGWGKVDRFRFSVWSSGTGQALYRLRDLRAAPADPAENRIKNGSFEIDGGGMPYAWGSGHWGVGRLPWAADMDLWRRRWRLDSAVVRDGRSSLRIENRPEFPLLKARSVWFTPPKKPAIWTVSAWLRADRDGLPVTLSCGKGSASVEVGRAWQQASVRVSRGKRLSVTIAPKASGTLWVDAVQVQACEKPTPEFHPSFDDEAVAAREGLVDWSPPRRTPEVAAGRSISGPTRPARIGIDAHGRFLVDGKPYVQHSLGLEFVSDPAILDFAARSGFKDVCIQVRPSLTTTQLKVLFDRCAKVGLRLIPWLDGRIPLKVFRQHIVTLKAHPALLCWYVYDEPSGAKFAAAERRLDLARQLDPAHPAFINYLGNRLADQAGDIYSTDVYPIPHSQPLSAIRAVARMAAAADREKKPVWMWLQGTGYAYWMDREPTPRELSCMVYGSFIAGARGIYYFAQIPRTKACFDEMRALCVEVDVVAPWLYSLGITPTVRCDREAVMCRAWRRDGRVLVVAVNTGAAPLSAAGFALPGTGEDVAEVLFEGRRVPVRDGRWRDGFGPYERHVYRLSAEVRR